MSGVRVKHNGFDLGRVDTIDFAGVGALTTVSARKATVSGQSMERFSVTGIDAKTTGATLIGTTRNTGERFYPVFIVVRTATADTVLAVASGSVGTNSTDYNNVVPITALTNLTTANLYLRWDITTATASIAANTGVYFKVTTGSTATAHTIDVHLVGYYQ